VGRRVIATSKSGIPGTVHDDEIVSGYPAHSHRRWKRAMAAVWRLPEVLVRLRVVERHLGLASAKESARPASDARTRRPAPSGGKRSLPRGS
jgi:hypothetical protein